MKIEQSWLAWAKNTVDLLKNGGHIVFPSDGAIFKVNKGNRTLNLVCCRPDWLNSDTERTNRSVFNGIGYTYTVPPEVPTDAKTMIERMKSNLDLYAFDIETLLEGVSVIFNISKDDLNFFRNKKGKSGINPVTIRGQNVLHNEDRNLTIGRLWLGTSSVPDTAHRFNMREQRVQWEKPISLAFWQNPNEALGMVVNEEEFVPAVKRLQAQENIVLNIHGTATRGGDEHRVVTFRRSSQNPDMLVSMYDFSLSEIGAVALDFAKFIDGLGHLFPNGELE